MEVKRIRNNFSDELYHHGIKGQRWGIRRYQNPDGSLTEAGRQRYMRSDGSYNSRYQKEIRGPKEKRAKTRNMSDAQIKRRTTAAAVGALAVAGLTMAAISKSDKIATSGRRAYEQLKRNNGQIKVSAIVNGKRVKATVENANLPSVNLRNTNHVQEAAHTVADVINTARKNVRMDSRNAAAIAGTAAVLGTAGQIAIAKKNYPYSQEYTRRVSMNKKGFTKVKH